MSRAPVELVPYWQGEFRRWVVLCAEARRGYREVGFLQGYRA